MDKARRTALAGAAALVIALVIAPAASALDEVNTNPLRKAVTVNGILRHERALQAIANANLGTRVSGTAGFDQSADYVKRQLVQAGYKVSEQSFEFPFFQETSPAVFERVSPQPRTAGEPYDACYHQACDTTNNLNTKALNELGDSVVHATWTLAKSKSGLCEDQSLRAKKQIKTKAKGPLAVR